MSSVYCPESDTTYPDLASFESAEQGTLDKAAVIDGKVSGATIKGWTGTLTIKSKSTPYDGTNSTSCDGLTSQLSLRNNNIRLDANNRIFIDGGSSVAIKIGAYEAVTGIFLTGGCQTSAGSGNYPITTYSGSGGQYDIDQFIVEQGGGHVWFRGAAPTSTVNALTVVNTGANETYRGGIDNDAGVVITNALSISHELAGNYDYISGNYGSSDHLASNDNSAESYATNSFTGATLADLVNVPGGNYNLSPGSPLYSAGLNNDPVGAVLTSAPVQTYDFSGSLSITAQAQATMQGEKSAVNKLQTNAITVSTIKGAKASSATIVLQNNSLTTSNGQKSASNSLLISGAATITVRGFKQAYGALALNNLASVSIQGTALTITGRTGSLSIVAQSKTTLKGNKGALGKLQLSNTAMITITGRKQALASLSLHDIAITNISAEKIAYGALSLTNTATVVLTQYSQSYVPVIRTLLIEGQIITLQIPGIIKNTLQVPGNINNTLTIEGRY